MAKDKVRESVGTCYVCKKERFKDESSTWVYHQSVGIVCVHHHGVKQWYNDLLKSAENELKQKGIQ